MKSKDIKKIIRAKMLEGKSYQECYEELNVTFPNREIDIAKLVGGEVTLGQQEKYKYWNLGLIALLGVAATSNVVIPIVKPRGEFWGTEMVFASMVSVACIVMIYYILQWRLWAYMTVAALGAVSLLEVATLTTGFKFDPTRGAIYGLLALASFLYTQLGGSYRTKATQYKDAKGLVRARHTITFKE